MNRTLIATAFLPLSACNEYEIVSKDDVEIGVDTDDRETGDVVIPASCAEPDAPDDNVPSDPSCEIAPQTGAFNPVLEWRMDTFSQFPGSNNVMATPVVGHITDDDADSVFGSAGDVPDIAVVTYGTESVLRIISGDGSIEHWSTTAGGIQAQSSPAIGDVDGDGDPEVVFVTDAGRILAYHHDGTQLWQSAKFDLAGPFIGSNDDELDFVTQTSTPAISDMNADGTPEVIVGRVIVNGANGNTLGVGSRGIGSVAEVGTTSFAVDLDGDGNQEVVTGNATYRRDGSIVHQRNASDGYVAVANFDSDPQGEIVVVRNGEVAVFHHNFDRLWGPVALGSGAGGPPTVADFDGDGEPEIGVAGQSIYTVFDTDGSVLWSRTVQDGTSGVTGSSVFDFEGDGIAEVVYADEITLWVFNGPDGAVKLQYQDHTSNTWLEYPVVADVDGDGSAEILFGHNPYQGQTTAFRGISVIADAADSWVPTRQIWNQHPYHLTNVKDDGGIPVNADANWLSFNNFRSGDIHAGEGSAAPDLVPEIVAVCEDACDEGEVFVWLRVRNEGAAASAPGIPVALLAESTLLGSEDLDAIAAGAASPVYVFQFNPDDLAGRAMSTHVGATANECDTTNNTEAWSETVCAP